MPSPFSIVNSQKKNNTVYIAAGSYQAEFFSIETRDYFAIHRLLPESPRLILIDLQKTSLMKLTRDVYIARTGSKTYKIKMLEKNGRRFLFVTLTLWGWLPIIHVGGIISLEGKMRVRFRLDREVSQ